MVALSDKGRFKQRPEWSEGQNNVANGERGQNSGFFFFFQMGIDIWDTQQVSNTGLEEIRLNYQRSQWSRKHFFVSEVS